MFAHYSRPRANRISSTGSGNSQELSQQALQFKYYRRGCRPKYHVANYSRTGDQSRMESLLKRSRHSQEVVLPEYADPVDSTSQQHGSAGSRDARNSFETNFSRNPYQSSLVA